MKYAIYCILFSLLFYACEPEGEDAMFTLLSSLETGIDFINELEETDSLNIIQYLYFYNGAGVAAGDFDGDGKEDLLFNSNQSHPQIYLNQSNEKISFKDVSLELQFDTITGWGTGVSLADINNDGRLDIYICQVGNFKDYSGYNRLLINMGSSTGSLKFEDKTEEYGLNFSGLSTQAAFLDYDLDGDLDMYLLNHSIHQTSNYAEASQREISDLINGDRFYRNDGMRFTDVTEQSGIFNSKIGYGLGISISDLDKNGYPDIYIGNDFHENDYLYMNHGDGTFSEQIKESTNHNSQFSMGVDIADMNEDGWADILSLDMMPEDPTVKQTTVGHDPYNIFLFKNQFGYHYQYPKNHLHSFSHLDNGIPRYADIAHFAGIEATDWSWSVLLEDFDNDGQKDVFVSNGILRRPNDLDYLNYIADPLVQADASDLQMIAKMPEGKVSNYFFHQTKIRQFKKVMPNQNPSLSNGACYADLDNDGDLELITNNINEPSFIYNNTASQNYIRIKLLGAENKFGIGAKLKLVTAGKSYYREVSPYKGMMSTSTTIMNMGLADNQQIDSIIVVWPNGNEQILLDVGTNKLIEIIEVDRAKQIVPPKSLNQKTIFRKTQIAGLDFMHHGDTRDYIKDNVILPFNNLKLGPCIAIGDLNNDNQKDIVISNSIGYTDGIFISTPEKKFAKTNLELMEQFKIANYVDADIQDADSDGDLDIIFANNNESYLSNISNSIFLNNGNGVFDDRINEMSSGNHSSVSSSDFDQDGDLDFFFGRLLNDFNKGKFYSRDSISNFWINEGLKKFTEYNNFDLQKLGSVSDAEWGDIDNDGDDDLVIVGEWMPVTIWINKGNGFSVRKIDDSDGLWRTVELVDLDGDSKLEIVAGNFGLNSGLVASVDKPITLYSARYPLKDSYNPIVVYQEDELLSGVDDLLKQMPVFKKSFEGYSDFIAKPLEDKFQNTLQELGQVVTLESTIFHNEGDTKFVAYPMPTSAQISTVNKILVDDINSDGSIDLLLVGNATDVNSSIGMQLSSFGTLLFNKGNLEFEPVSNQRSGLHLEGVATAAEVLNINGNKHFLFGIYNDSLQVYTLNQ